ncbi:MAG: choice-of-anchor J domain-containing protein [Bacteroidales bacterium]|nr:choice-of-anchor J domain-containing protein [Bacteroidales bacterium]
MKNKYYLTKALLVTAMATFFFTATAVAQCVIPIAPGQSYTENFDSGQMECWTVETSGSATWAVMNGTTSNVASFQNASAGDEARLISPTFDLSGSSSATFSFSYAMMALYPPYDELAVSYRTSETDSWHDLGSYSLSDWTNTYDEMFTLSDLSATFQVSFLGHCNGGYYIFIDDIEIASAGGCARPVNLQATEITAFSALLGWSTTGNEESWTIELNGENLIVNTQPYLLENLSSGRDYTFRVKANCGGGMESEWSQPTSFKTLCDVIVVTDEEPYFDDFEASEEFVCWQSEILSGEDNWVIDPGYLILNNTAFFIWLGEEAMLVSAPLDITAVSNPVLTFKHKQQQLDGRTDELSVWYATSLDDYWHLLAEYTYACDDWESVTHSLPEASSTYYIAFKGKSNNADGVYVDDVWVGNDDGVGIGETSSVKAVVSPNPTNGKVMLDANVSEGEVAVFDTMGKQVAFATLNNGRAELDLSAFAKGVYVARITTEAGTSIIKLVKE